MPLNPYSLCSALSVCKWLKQEGRRKEGEGRRGEGQKESKKGREGRRDL